MPGTQGPPGIGVVLECSEPVRSGRPPAPRRASSRRPRRRAVLVAVAPGLVELRAGLLDVDVRGHLGVARPGSRPGCRPPRGTRRRPPPPRLAVGGLDLDHAGCQQREDRHVVGQDADLAAYGPGVDHVASPDQTSRSAATSSTCRVSVVTHRGTRQSSSDLSGWCPARRWYRRAAVRPAPRVTRWCYCSEVSSGSRPTSARRRRGHRT